MSTDARTVVATDVDSWKAHGLKAFRSILADDVVIDGPLGHVDNADDCTKKRIRPYAGIMTDIVVTKVFVDGPDVVTWYDMHGEKTGPMPIANWCHVEHGKIARIRVTFDPRLLLKKPDVPESGHRAAKYGAEWPGRLTQPNRSV